MARCARDCLRFGLQATSQQVASLKAPTLFVEMGSALGPSTSRSNAIGGKLSRASLIRTRARSRTLTWLPSAVTANRFGSDGGQWTIPRAVMSTSRLRDVGRRVASAHEEIRSSGWLQEQCAHYGEAVLKPVHQTGSISLLGNEQLKGRTPSEVDGLIGGMRADRLGCLDHVGANEKQCTYLLRKVGFENLWWVLVVQFKNGTVTEIRRTSAWIDPSPT